MIFWSLVRHSSRCWELALVQVGQLQNNAVMNVKILAAEVHKLLFGHAKVMEHLHQTRHTPVSLRVS